jgi:hypothetical protein
VLPARSTLLWALDLSEELTTIPGLTTALIKNHLPRSTATDKGHMHRHQANTSSMHNMQSNIIPARAKVDCMFPSQEICATQDMFCFAALSDAITGTMYTNITDAFPVHSFKSMQYVFVAYIYNLNAIIVRAMMSRTDASMVQAFTKVISTLKSGGYHPALNVMDNECSSMVKKYIRSKSINIQLVPRTTIKPMPPNAPSPLSRNTSLLPLPPLICFAPFNSGMNFSRRSNLP